MENKHQKAHAEREESAASWLRVNGLPERHARYLANYLLRRERALEDLAEKAKRERDEWRDRAGEAQAERDAARYERDEAQAASERERAETLKDIALQEFNGNSVCVIWDKMIAYRDGVDALRQRAEKAERERDEVVAALRSVHAYLPDPVDVGTRIEISSLLARLDGDDGEGES